MTTRSQQPPTPNQQAQSPLAQCLTAMAGTPDDSSWIASQLVALAQLAADLVAPVSCASVTAYREDAWSTVAASSDVAAAVDEAQYAEQAGPCLDALDGGSPVAVPEITTALAWPGFRAAAVPLGLRASLSIPLFAGRGTAIAVLNLYGHDPDTMVPLTAALWDAYDPHGSTIDREHPLLDCGGAGLVAGLVGAFAVRALIQQAIGVVIADTQRTVDAGYLILRLRAAETGLTLPATATAVIAEQYW